MQEEADLVDHYKGIRRDAKGRQIGNSELFTRWRVRKHLLDDLYIRFFRLAEKRIGECADFGVVSFISNSSYLVGRSHPIMRESLLQHFNRIWIDNLHGNRLASERTPQGDSCETIFNMETGGPGIKVGTAISTLLKMRNASRKPSTTQVFVRDFWGRAALKRQALLASLDLDRWAKVRRNQASQLAEGPRPYGTFRPVEENRWKLAPLVVQGGYEEWPGLDELFPRSIQGVNPNRGLQGSIVEIDRDILLQRMKEYFSDLSYDEFAKRHSGLCQAFARYDPRTTRERLLKRSSFPESRTTPYLLFPFDVRWIYYETEAKLLNERRPDLWDNLEGNEFLITVPQPRRTSES